MVIIFFIDFVNLASGAPRQNHTTALSNNTDQSDTDTAVETYSDDNDSDQDDYLYDDDDDETHTEDPTIFIPRPNSARTTSTYMNKFFLYGLVIYFIHSNF